MTTAATRNIAMKNAGFGLPLDMVFASREGVDHAFFSWRWSRRLQVFDSFPTEPQRFHRATENSSFNFLSQNHSVSAIKQKMLASPVTMNQRRSNSVPLWNLCVSVRTE